MYQQVSFLFFLYSVFDTYETEIEVNKQTISFELWDTAGSENFDLIRHMSYDDADVFLVVYSVSKPESLKNVEKKWIPDIKKKAAKGTSYVIAGNKVDLRNSKKEDERSKSICLISTREGKELAKNLKAHSFWEVSAKTKHGLKEIFDDIVSIAFEKLQRDHGLDKTAVKEAKKKCVML